MNKKHIAELRRSIFGKRLEVPENLPDLAKELLLHVDEHDHDHDNDHDYDDHDHDDDDDDHDHDDQSSA